MTAQVPDDIEIDGRYLTIQGVRGGALFDPADLGWKTRWDSTDNRRGYSATYAIADGRLVLRSLGINFAFEFLKMTDPIWELYVRDGAGETTCHHIFKQDVSIRTTEPADIVWPDHDMGRAYLTYTPTCVHLRGRPNLSIAFGEEVQLGPYAIRPIEVLGYAALATAELPKLGHSEGVWYPARKIPIGEGRSVIGMPRSGYRDVDLPIPLTGGILACKGFIRELYVHMGFHPAWKFEHVEELLFEDGRLVDHRDVSKELAEVREVLKKQPRKPSLDKDGVADILAWTKRCFELDY